MIPKIIHYCWFGGNEFTEKEKKCIESWKKYCSDYKFIEWNESNYDISTNLYIKQAYEAKKWAFVTDFVRLDVIYRYGGIYLDTDVEIIRRLDPLLEHQAFAGIENVLGDGGYSVATGLGFGAEKGNHIIGAWRSIYDNLSFVQADGTEDLLTTPARTTYYLKSKGFRQIDTRQIIDGMVIYPTEYFCPKEYNSGRVNITKNTYSIHHYTESWKSDEERKQNKEWLRLKNKYGDFLGELILVIQNKYRERGVTNIIQSIFRIIVRIIYGK